MSRRAYTVGVRELKTQASRIFRRIRDTGQEVAVTHHGKVIAHIVSAEGYHKLKAGRTDFWDALRGFRERVDLPALGIGDELATVRDRSNGRKFRW